jgi:hypothetical protein
MNNDVDRPYGTDYLGAVGAVRPRRSCARRSPVAQAFLLAGSCASFPVSMAFSLKPDMERRYYVYCVPLWHREFVFTFQVDLHPTPVPLQTCRRRNASWTRSSTTVLWHEALHIQQAEVGTNSLPARRLGRSAVMISQCCSTYILRSVYVFAVYLELNPQFVLFDSTTPSLPCSTSIDTFGPMPRSLAGHDAGSHWKRVMFSTSSRT